ncbi:MAG TPA: beta-ketoacyl synthase N-terminal-like domain-containing protein [Noviherbaspirillum sp.]|nr:beta-ketoacyl synthase N-terminal-like domain-containing protein [Noviherbaspirillum sp.]
MKRKAYLDGGATYCSAGIHIETIWQHLVSGQRALSELPCPAFDSWPWPQVFTVEEPSFKTLNVDRKLLRTMEKQSAVALYGATLALRDSAVLGDYDKSRVGLYMGLPTVEDPAPTWSSLQMLHENGGRVGIAEACLRETPPFFALTQLNSSACAHIAGTFGMTGAMGAYSPFSDAGLHAVIEAALSLHESENDAALVGGVSQKINPLLLLQYEHLGWTKDPTRIPGEGAAFVVLNTEAKGTHRIWVSGYARGFISDDFMPDAYAHILRQALSMASIDAADLDWMLADAESAGELAALRALYGAADIPLGGCRQACGVLGPAEPIVNLLLAEHGMHHGKRLCIRGADGLLTEELQPIRHALICTRGPEGQYVVVILSAELA